MPQAVNLPQRLVALRERGVTRRRDQRTQRFDIRRAPEARSRSRAALDQIRVPL
jgi:hypothetical protein